MLAVLAFALAAAAAPPAAPASPASSALQLHRLFSDDMVLQAESPRVYGRGSPGCTVTVVASDNVEPAGVRAAVDAQGAWTAVLKPRPASSLNATGPGLSITVSMACGGVGAPEEHSSSSGVEVVLRDVLFGDVWVCGGQSNMEFSVAEAFDRDTIIATAAIPGLRLYAVQKNRSNAPLDEPRDIMYPEGWVKSSPDTVCGAEYNNNGYKPPHNTTAYCGPHCGPSAAVKSFARATWGYFSAVCFTYGRALLRDTGRPQGLIASCWGGTAIERWSNAEALQECSSGDGDYDGDGGGDDDGYGSYGGYGGGRQLHQHRLPGTDHGVGIFSPATPASPSSPSFSSTTPTSVPSKNGNLFNGMIAPLLRFPIKGAIWYQGESNARHAPVYACQMRAMIRGWRDAWVGNPPANRNFTFVLHQLSACTYSGDVPALRWSQQGAVAPWSSLPRVAMSVGLDLSDPASPCANVHIRNKTAVGERMARAGRALGYPNSEAGDTAFTGPVASTFTLSSSSSSADDNDPASAVPPVPLLLTVGFSGATPPLRFRTIAQTTRANLTGVEVNYDDASVARDSGSSGSPWIPVPAHVTAYASKGRSGTAAAAAAAAPFPSIVVDLGSVEGHTSGAVPRWVRYAWQSVPDTQLLYDSTVNGEYTHGLPAPPWWVNCTASAGCALIPPGELPTV